MSWKEIIFDDTISSGTLSWNNTIATSDTNTDWKYHSATEYINGSAPYRKTATEIALDAIKNKINERSKDMMGLYEVYVVDTKKNLFAVDQIIAKDARIAERKANIPDDYNLDDCVFFTELVGEWESRKPKEVKIVKE